MQSAQSEAAAPRWPAAAAAALAVLAFLPSLAGGWVYDDHRFLGDNTALGSWSVLVRAFTDPAVQTADATHAGLWRPLRTLSFALDRALFAGAPWGSHAVNLVLHGAGAWLVARLLAAWRCPPWGACLGAAVYALHPAQVESVAWISSRGDLLCAAALWSALLLADGGRDRAALVAGALALLSKEQAVVWPVLAALSAHLAGAPLRRAARTALAPFVVTIVFLAARHLLLAEPFQEGGLGDPSPATAQVAAGLAHQAVFAVLPVRSVFDWQLPVPRGPGLGLFVSLGVCAALARRATRPAVAWFLAALAPTLLVQLLVPLNILVAERFLLVALPALGWLAGRAVARDARLVVPLAVALCAFGVLTQRSLPRWRSDRALWSSVVDGDPGHWRANHWLGVDALRSGEADAWRIAVDHLERAAAAGPGDAKTRYHLAVALERRAAHGADPAADMEKARQEYMAALVLFAGRRQEGADGSVPLARIAVVDLTLGLGQREHARSALEALLAEPPPAVPQAQAAAWRNRVARLADRVAEHLDPGARTDLAPRMRQWAGLP